MLCDHGREGFCLLCGGRAARRGLEPIVGAIGGTFIRRDVYPGTPVDQGKWRRYLPSGVEQDALFQPDSGIATITNPTNYREASPTGKVGGGDMFARLQSQDFDGANANATALLQPRAIPRDARRITRAQIDAWGSTVGKVSWSPGDMAREAVSG